MTDTKPDFTATTDLVAGLLDGVDDAALTGATPCGHYTQAQLINHLLGLCLAFTAAARGETGPHNDAPPGEPPTDLAPGWRDELRQRLHVLAEAWSEETAWKGDALAGGVTLPAPIMGLVALNEVAVHGWDLASATGQPYTLDPVTVQILTAFTGQDADDQAAREGIYAPVVTIPASASPQDHLLALTGRNPAWSP
jgi:uncharacterized protein (TIGR03086 family)